ncbi:hypothetical protein GIY23_21255 [Allosaccharopolyspora coralli]|uniref:Uncharacterized protein n=1 Tax=Allosaccharopolyspora coralli TaxID=2665642 RepID=A0A5Q3QEA7_9PSEU|nr:hypothetical protein [Allosaccharopolyspora coralli]QGK71706.1 hypothetical protein GIY23_21255 [Allosaccharopolyspora coralli]
MDGSLDVRQFLWQQDGAATRSSGEVPAPRNGEPARITPEQVHRARIAVARGARDVDDCKMLLDMLGLSGDEDGEAPVSR